MGKFQIIVAQGLTFGCLSAPVGAGLRDPDHTTKVFHIAYGAIGVFGSFVAVELYSGAVAWKLILSLLAGAAAAFLLTVATFNGPYRFMERRGADRLGTFVALLGVAYSIPPVLILVFGPEIRS